jgi:undecaprenyl-diphosphatase
MGFDRQASARYAFLLAVPAVLASAVLEALSIGESSVAWPQTIVATLVAFVVGYTVIATLMRYLSHGSFRPFVIYRLALGVVLLLLLASGTLSAS